MTNYYNVRLKGGVTTDRYSPPCDGSGTGTLTLSIPASSTIAKAYLWAGECGSSNSVTVTLTGASSQSLTFNNSTRVGTPFNSNYGANSCNHMIDITSIISPTVNTYTLTVPAQTFNVSQRFQDFRLVVVFANNAFDVCNVVIYLNNQSMVSAYNHTYNLSFVIPISTGANVALGMHVGYVCNDQTTGSGSHDSENIEVNNTLLGHIGSTTGNGFCSGSGYRNTGGNFEYHNGTLTALADCNANQAMSGLDGLSNVVALLTNGATTAVLECNSEEINNYTNNIWGCIWVYKDTVPTYPYEGNLCAASFATSGITQTAANFSWKADCVDPQPAVNISNLQYRVVGSPTWIQSPNNPVALSDSLTGLTSNTSYEWQVVNISTDGAVFAPSAIYTFTTLP